MWSRALVYLVLFFLIANPSTFKLVRKALGAWVASPEGLPTSAGLLLHAIVYVTLACYIPGKFVGKSMYAPGDQCIQVCGPPNKIQALTASASSMGMTVTSAPSPPSAPAPAPAPTPVIMQAPPPPKTSMYEREPEPFADD